MKNRKGFTLVELLAVVVILGIIMVIAIPAVSRWIDRGKKESLESQKKTLLMAAQSYAQGNSSVLPKAIGETTIIKVQDLKSAKYLKEDIKDADKNSCMKDSFVRVYKYDRKKYTYTAYIYCEGDIVPDEIVGIKPNIDISFTGTPQEGKIQSIIVSKVIIEMDGNVDSEGNPLGLDGYSYSISVQYNNTGELVEIFHSGSLNAGGRNTLTIEKDLSEYVDIRKANYFVVTAEAYNRDGGHEKKTGNSLYDDDTPPSCGAITGEAGDNEWSVIKTTRTITVACIDNENGSGCIKDSYTKTFDHQMKNGSIIISDNAGNETTCTVKVHQDWTKPTLTIVAYTRTSSGGKGTEIGRATSSATDDNSTLRTYTGNVNGWLNNASFPYGVYYEMNVSDNVSVKEGNWSYNASGLFSSSSPKLSVLVGDSTDSFASSNTLSHYLSAEGLRRAQYILKDEAGNATTLNIEVNMDRTNPTCSASKDNTTLNLTTGVTVNVSCSDSGSGCSSSNTLSYKEQKASTTYTVKDNANNTGTCPITITAQNQTRTRDWNSCKTGQNTCKYGCDSCRDCVKWLCCRKDNDDFCTYSNSSSYGTNYECACWEKGAAYDCHCSNCKTGSDTCTGGWDDWTSWSNVNSCSASSSSSSERQCRTLYS